MQKISPGRTAFWFECDHAHIALSSSLPSTSKNTTTPPTRHDRTRNSVLIQHDKTNRAIYLLFDVPEAVPQIEQARSAAALVLQPHASHVQRSDGSSLFPWLSSSMVLLAMIPKFFFNVC